MQGDLLYLKAKLLGGAEYEITCTTDGFYVNDCVEGGRFHPDPHRDHACFSHSLAGLFYQLSTEFGPRLEEHLKNVLNAEPYLITPCTVPTFEWLSPFSARDPRARRTGEEEEGAAS